MSRASYSKDLQGHQAQTDLDGFVYAAHRRQVERALALSKASPVDRANLIQDDSRRLAKATLPARRNDHFAWALRRCELRTDRRHNCDGAVLIGSVILNYDCRGRLLNFMPNRWVESDEVNLAAAGKGHVRFEIVARFPRGFRLDFSNVFQASSSSGNHSAASAKSRSALTIASSFSRARRFDLAFGLDEVPHCTVNEAAPVSICGNPVEDG